MESIFTQTNLAFQQSGLASPCFMNQSLLNSLKIHCKRLPSLEFPKKNKSA